MNQARTSPLRVAIVDDDPDCRQHLRALLSQQPGVDIAGEAQSARDLRAQWNRLKAEVVFLDIEMPGQDGLDLSAQLPEDVAVVFVTGFTQHALRGYEVGAVDYLLKPVREPRLQATLNRLRRRARATPAETPITLTINRQPARIDPANIVAVTSHGTYTEVWLADGTHQAVWRSLDWWIEQLPPHRFAPASRQALVALDKLQWLELGSEGCWARLTCAPGRLSVSRRRAAELRHLLTQRENPANPTGANPP